MTKEEYERQRQQILKDDRYTPALKQWALGELEKQYEAYRQRYLRMTKNPMAHI